MYMPATLDYDGIRLSAHTPTRTATTHGGKSNVKNVGLPTEDNSTESGNSYAEVGAVSSRYEDFAAPTQQQQQQFVKPPHRLVNTYTHRERDDQQRHVAHASSTFTPTSTHATPHDESKQGCSYDSDHDSSHPPRRDACNIDRGIRQGRHVGTQDHASTSRGDDVRAESTISRATSVHHDGSAGTSARLFTPSSRDLYAYRSRPALHSSEKEGNAWQQQQEHERSSSSDSRPIRCRSDVAAELQKKKAYKSVPNATMRTAADEEKTTHLLSLAQARSGRRSDTESPNWMALAGASSNMMGDEHDDAAVDDADADEEEDALMRRMRHREKEFDAKVREIDCILNIADHQLSMRDGAIDRLQSELDRLRAQLSAASAPTQESQAELLTTIARLVHELAEARHMRQRCTSQGKKSQKARRRRKSTTSRQDSSDGVDDDDESEEAEHRESEDDDEDDDEAPRTRTAGRARSEPRQQQRRRHKRADQRTREGHTISAIRGSGSEEEEDNTHEEHGVRALQRALRACHKERHALRTDIDMLTTRLARSRGARAAAKARYTQTIMTMRQQHSSDLAEQRQQLLSEVQKQRQTLTQESDACDAHVTELTQQLTRCRRDSADAVSAVTRQLASAQEECCVTRLSMARLLHVLTEVPHMQRVLQWNELSSEFVFVGYPTRYFANLATEPPSASTVVAANHAPASASARRDGAVPFASSLSSSLALLPNEEVSGSKRDGRRNAAHRPARAAPTTATTTNTGVEGGVYGGATSSSQSKNVCLNERWCAAMQSILHAENDYTRLRQIKLLELEEAGQVSHSLQTARDVLQCRRPERDYWIPYRVFQEAQAFKNTHCAKVPALAHFYPFLLKLNRVWNEKLQDRLRVCQTRTLSSGVRNNKRSISTMNHNGHATVGSNCNDNNVDHAKTSSPQARCDQQDYAASRKAAGQPSQPVVPRQTHAGTTGKATPTHHAGSSNWMSTLRSLSHNCAGALQQHEQLRRHVRTRITSPRSLQLFRLYDAVVRYVAACAQRMLQVSKAHAIQEQQKQCSMYSHKQGSNGKEASRNRNHDEDDGDGVDAEEGDGPITGVDNKRYPDCGNDDDINKRRNGKHANGQHCIRGHNGSDPSEVGHPSHRGMLSESSDEEDDKNVMADISALPAAPRSHHRSRLPRSRARMSSRGAESRHISARHHRRQRQHTRVRNTHERRMAAKQKRLTSSCASSSCSANEYRDSEDDAQSWAGVVDSEKGRAHSVNQTPVKDVHNDDADESRRRGRRSGVAAVHRRAKSSRAYRGDTRHRAQSMHDGDGDSDGMDVMTAIQLAHAKELTIEKLLCIIQHSCESARDIASTVWYKTKSHCNDLQHVLSTAHDEERRQCEELSVRWDEAVAGALELVSVVRDDVRGARSAIVEVTREAIHLAKNT